ncbi:hypothetical protein BXY85_2063 [Roseivirga pacifica]|uniref:Uncharacterized protein n=1 Tax=Roseivirga pacifica TaxID=1267423 RepID=A0A1I0NAV9_9BACT|nr:hypothetical protein [Roseivirga pacifica]RKQ51041.1 hypothetical protein BXY85_2063 [Roseivirga pacifica]SEV98135.1 hypothetical protein SAMN05216290_1045 [Roseivirga pacifica]
MRKNTLQYTLTFLLSLFLGALLIWALWYLESPEDKIAVFGIVAIILAALTSVLTVSISNNKVKQREYDLLILKEKQKVYDHFYEMLFEIFGNTLKGKNNINHKVSSEMMLFKRGLMNWGSERLITKYLEYESNLSILSKLGSTKQMINASDDFLKEIRKEMGFEDSKRLSLMSIVLKEESRKELGVL